ncbi:MAG TPA: single-stranded DNA-binding protein [Ruminococcaceae bacterium]|nr:single-stranded DNA-binding protein [Oscillospiraceae bacterium]
MLNVAILMGRLTADPELRHTQNSIPVTSFTLAIDRSYAKSGTERVTDFIDIVAWRSTAEFAAKYFRKGQLVAVEGSIQVRAYVDKNGNNRRAFEIQASQVHFAERKRDAYEAPGGTPPQYEPSAPPAFDNSGMGDFEEIVGTDDDLPF